MPVFIFICSSGWFMYCTYIIAAFFTPFLFSYFSFAISYFHSLLLRNEFYPLVALVVL